MSVEGNYEIVELASGTRSVRCCAYAETFHPVIGPVAEAEALYVRQLRIPERFIGATDFTIWDVGLGAGANVLTTLRHLEGIPGALRIVSFDKTIEPLRFALAHAEELGYLASFQTELEEILENGNVQFRRGELHVSWNVIETDFPGLMASEKRSQFPAPNAVLFDAFSPAKNPEMWTNELFTNIRASMPASPSALATYSRATSLRVSLLLAGFFVGAGSATGEKEETTIAANTPSLIERPLDQRWLERARNSTSAEPLWEPVYRQARLSPASLERLLSHPQFR